MTYVGTTAAAVGTGVGSVVCPLPAGAQAGDRALLTAWNNNSTGTHSAPGATVHHNVTGVSAMSKSLTQADIDTGSITVTRLTNQTNAGGVVLKVYRDVGTVQAAQAAANTTGTSTSLTLPTVTAAQADSTLVQGVTKVASGTSWTPPATATERAEGSTTGTVTLYAAGDEIVPAGATGTRVWTRGGTDTGASRGAIYVLNPPQTLAPSGIGSTASVGTPTVAPGAVTVSPSGIGSTASVGTPNIPAPLTVSPTGIDSTATVGTPTLPPPLTVSPSGIDSTSSVGTPTVTPGSTAVSPPSIPGTSTVGAPVLTPGEVLVVPQSVLTGATVGAPTLEVGAAVINPAGIEAGSTVGVPAVILGTATLRPTGIAPTSRVGEPIVSVPGPADECWPIDLSCVTDWDDVVDGEPRYSTAQKTRAIQLAGMTMRLLTGFRVGGCPITVRPCSQACSEQTWRVYPLMGNGGAPWAPYLVEGEWLNIGCGCASDCGCGGVQEVELGMPASRVSEVKLDGVVLSPSAYRLDRGGRLVRLDGGKWPTCQNLNDPDTEPGTWSITYVPGHPVDANGAFAAGILAGQYVRACTGGDCDLPSNVTRIVRQGVELQFATGLFPEGRTGIREVDVYLERWNPGNLKAPARVTSPELLRRRPR